MKNDELRSLLDRLPGIRHACDLDLLLFFRRHPCALLTSEHLVAYLGYDRERVAQSLEGLIAAGLLTRSQNPSHAARLYTLEPGGASGGLLQSLLEIAGSRQGRADVMRLLDPTTGHPPGARALRAARVVKIA